MHVRRLQLVWIEWSERPAAALAASLDAFNASISFCSVFIILLVLGLRTPSLFSSTPLPFVEGDVGDNGVIKIPFCLVGNRGDESLFEFKYDERTPFASDSNR
jgi:hypothetical protein